VENCGKLPGWKTNQGVAKSSRALVDGARGEATPTALSMCSACAGDYEDPDRTAWSRDDAGDEDANGVVGARTNEFPAEE